MIYIWDNKHRNDTIRMCIDSLNRTQGMHIVFDFCETNAKEITVWFKTHGNRYAIYLFWNDLAHVVRKPDAEVIDFEKLTEKQYLALCKHIMVSIWDVVGIIE